VSRMERSRRLPRAQSTSGPGVGGRLPATKHVRPPASRDHGGWWCRESAPRAAKLPNGRSGSWDRSRDRGGRRRARPRVTRIAPRDGHRCRRSPCVVRDRAGRRTETEPAALCSRCVRCGTCHTGGVTHRTHEAADGVGTTHGRHQHRPGAVTARSRVRGPGFDIAALSGSHYFVAPLGTQDFGACGRGGGWLSRRPLVVWFRVIFMT